MNNHPNSNLSYHYRHFLVNYATYKQPNVTYECMDALWDTTENFIRDTSDVVFFTRFGLNEYVSFLNENFPSHLVDKICACYNDRRYLKVLEKYTKAALK